ncbi:MAG: hypothetical protein MUC84_02680 [Solirubrobacteraceae bacterium]|nr:hypothetical protein [Solirubrobacteraceae bacterium]MCU0312952.1 hypothetical protein [Solirubrobacteraceae bacterium]
MRAKAAYRLIVTRTGRVPGILAADRVDQIEVQSLDDLEVVLFWDVPARETTRMEAALREDLERLDAEEFLARWRAFEVGGAPE